MLLEMQVPKPMFQASELEAKIPVSFQQDNKGLEKSKFAFAIMEKVGGKNLCQPTPYQP